KATNVDRFIAAERVVAVARSSNDAVRAAAKVDMVDLLGAAAWSALLAGHPQEAAEFSEAAHALAPARGWIEVNHAHALLLLGHYDQAKEIYLAVKDQPSATDRARPLRLDISEDFAIFRQLGLATGDVERMKKDVGVE